MSARKLQQEMDRVFKRVSEGCAQFDLLYQKLQNASNQSQKEKHEQDLKREIKKLQKLRDQIKTWIAMNEIRDKKQLLENRRLIENDMERFKAVEREVKTKAYSKEGLMRSNDPYAKEKHEATEFITQQIESLEQQIMDLEEEQDTLINSTKKSKRDQQRQDRINEIDHFVERHKWHIQKMELMISMIEQDKLAPESVMDLQDDILYYVESNQEVDFAEDEAIYDDLKLIGEDENEIVETIVRDDTYSLEDLAQDLSKEAALKKKEEKEKEKKEKKEKEKSLTPMESPLISNSVPPGMQPVPNVPVVPAVPAVPVVPMAHPVPQHNTVVHSNAPSAAPSAAPSPVPTPLSMAHAPPGMDKRSPSPNLGINPLPPPSVPAPKLSDSYRKGAHLAQGGATAPTPMPAPSPAIAHQPLHTTQTNTQTNLNAAAQTASNIIQQSDQENFMLDLSQLPPGLQDLVKCLDAPMQRLSNPSLYFKNENVNELVTNSFLNTPDAQMSDMPQYYHPQNPYPTPDYYPQDALPTLEDPEVFKEMHVDTLFYIFYYCQNTHQQFLAAKELKSRSWRFHKQFLTWFQRQEDPTLITDEFEEGTYRFFDFEGSWVQRRKTNFKFEFKFLEDEI